MVAEHPRRHNAHHTRAEDDGVFQENRAGSGFASVLISANASPAQQPKQKPKDPTAGREPDASSQ
jgi:hypothetical protein